MNLQGHDMAERATIIKVLIVDDHPLFREGLQQLVARDSDLEVCGEASTGTEAMELISEHKPDLVVVDISLGASSGIDLIKTIRSTYDDLPVLVVSMHDESLYAERSLRAGAMGYVMKHESGKTVRAAIRKVLSGEMYLSERMSSTVISKFMRGQPDRPASPLETLSDRELEVFRMLGHGKGTRQIADRVHKARNGWGWHLSPFPSKDAMRRHCRVSTCIGGTLPPKWGFRRLYCLRTS